MMSDGRPVLLRPRRECERRREAQLSLFAGMESISTSIRWPLPSERDVAAHLTSRINRLRDLTIHTIEAFPRRRGVAVDSIVHQRARNEAQLLPAPAPPEPAPAPLKSTPLSTITRRPHLSTISIRPGNDGKLLVEGALLISTGANVVASSPSKADPHGPAGTT